MNGHGRLPETGVDFLTISKKRSKYELLGDRVQIIANFCLINCPTDLTVKV